MSGALGMSVLRMLPMVVSGALAIVVFARAFLRIIRSGRVGAGGASVERARRPRLYWAIVSVLAGMGLLVAIVLAQGASQLLGWRAAERFLAGLLDRLFWAALPLLLSAAMSVLVYRAVTTGTIPLQSGEIGRSRSPALFWMLTLMYGSIGLIGLLVGSGLMPFLLVHL